MAAVTRPGPFATKPVDQLIETAEGTRLHRAVGALDLTALGIGAIIGTLYGYRNSRLRRGGGDGRGGSGRFDRPSGAPSAPAPERTT
jgi:hypothetical protein